MNIKTNKITTYYSCQDNFKLTFDCNFPFWQKYQMVYFIIISLFQLTDGFHSIPHSCPPPAPPKLDNLVSKSDLQNLQKELKDKLDQVTKSISHMENELTKVKDESSKFKEFNEKSADSLEKVKRQLNDSEQLLEKYEHKLSEMNNKIPEIPTVNYKEQNEMHNNVLKGNLT